MTLLTRDTASFVDEKCINLFDPDRKFVMRGTAYYNKADSQDTVYIFEGNPLTCVPKLRGVISLEAKYYYTIV
ncbi:MAG: hypothetical protein IKF52_03965 [Clostridia bacterium]|nr:hypothetical protein [Clostridia bacterium]